MKGIIEHQTNGSSGQFAKRAIDTTSPSSSSSSFVPYPSNEAVIEQEIIENATTAFVEGLPRLFEVLGNPPVASSLYGLWPNPFFAFNASDENLQKQKDLMLVDGSEDGQVNPIVPLIQKARHTDFIIVGDNSGSELSSGWMNGTNFIITSKWAKGNNLPFPELPDVNTMLNVSSRSFRIGRISC